MDVGAGLYMYVVVVQKFTFAILSPDEFLYIPVLYIHIRQKGLYTAASIITRWIEYLLQLGKIVNWLQKKLQPEIEVNEYSSSKNYSSSLLLE